MGVKVGMKDMGFNRRCGYAGQHSSARGFTLIELIVVISLLGILASVGATLMMRPINAFSNAASAARLSDDASRALQRMGDELRHALPNSIRVTSSGADFYVEFIPLTGVGRYRAQAASSGLPGDVLDFTDAADNSFDVLGPMPSLTAASQLVIHNLGWTATLSAATTAAAAWPSMPPTACWPSRRTVRFPAIRLLPDSPWSSLPSASHASVEPLVRAACTGSLATASRRRSRCH
jgi:prepilin-type N-terminal cleavage/methylation domain-containing protein